MLGIWLVDDGIITEAQLEQALNAQLHGGGRLGDILISMGATTPYKLYTSLAAQLQLPFVNLLSSEWDHSFLDKTLLTQYIRLRVLPLGYVGKSKVMRVATSEPGDPQVKKFCYEYFPEGVELCVTSPFDIRRSIEQHFADELSDESRHRLARAMPEKSAHKRLSTSQAWLLFVFFIAYMTSFIFDSYSAAAFTLLIAHLLYVLALSFKSLVFLAGLKPKHYAEPVSPLDTKDLPSFTLLVPLYQETAILPQLLDALGKLDYPPQKLDIKLVLEADDEATYRAAIAYKPHYHFDIIRVPPSAPRTKPKACNYALAFAKGDIITIYDAEDKPDPKQLLKVAHMFDAAPVDVNTIQAKLRYYNAKQNMLTRFFDMEYAILFEHLLSGLERLGIPIPLGGTSNHINAERFRELGHWDPFNVTEDADLGMRFATSGYKTQMVDSTTMEEAPATYLAWLKQRSRWIKGHIQTWLVHNRKPGKLIKTLGWHGYLGFNLFLGLPYILYLTAPFIIALSYLWTEYGVFRDVLPTALTSLMAFNLIAYLIIHWLQAAWAYRRTSKGLKDWLAIFLFPAYWVLHILTSFRSLWQLITKPFYWEKTAHGEHLTKN